MAIRQMHFDSDESLARRYHAIALLLLRKLGGQVEILRTDLEDARHWNMYEHRDPMGDKVVLKLQEKAQ